ncbi:Asp-tRNA(Asn)/Glu-tRNA(Gln) amidotransferase GatCAB subunit B [archaeon]|nr:Asp-tRNA(Asn)/Glu-tRNA(Gln) amidotransferase GatCAB subunit B [archaeon]|tara:strand:+ start:2775 stop:4160 length:1386 start_codon:yes stop_codon:yes gene_type:complete
MKKSKVKIGLEIHVPLNTKSKLFCGCPTIASKPNESTCEICLGMPGSKPKLNKSVVNKATKLALALNCSIQKTIIFSRKTYFYPDLCKNFQITQLSESLAINGFMDVKDKKIPIWRVQIEEDPGSLQHKEDYCLIDYNRSGTPLVEIVTGPEFENSEEVVEFLQKLTTILDYLELYNPQNSSIRADVNVSISNNNRVEIKNLSGSKAIEKAIDFEIMRQKIKLKKGEKIEQQTMHYDAESGTTFLSREKESEEDYGYIFEPDLPILEFDKNFIKKIQADIPELPFQRFERFKKEYSLIEKEAYTITKEKATADLFESLYKEIDKKYLKNWMVVSLRKVLNYNKVRFADTKIKEGQVKDLLKRILDKRLTPRSGEFVLRELVEKPNDIDKIIKKLGLGKISEKEVEKIISNILQKNKKAVKDYKEGKEKSLQFLIGQVIRKIKGRADAKEVTKLILKKIKSN